MIEKRYQRYSSEGIVWTNWFRFKEEGTEEEVKFLNRNPETKWQLKSQKLLNQYRLTK